MSFNNVFQGKKVLITGNTGFKGSWLTTWMLALGADVYGYSIDIPTKPSIFEILDLEHKITHKYGDITDRESFNAFVQTVKPDFIFHLAAQAIVSISYSKPFETITTNVVGTASVCDAITKIEWPCTCIIITSDKAYDNVEWIWGYKESDTLGGKDIYSGSKGAAELIIKSYWHSFIQQKKNINLGIARAGNVIGGGDWAKDRIVVDCMKSFSEKLPVGIRSPKATRPWQHVLEPLSGYLTLAQQLIEGKIESGEAFNFGPRAEQTKTVLQLVRDLAKLWDLNPDDFVQVTGDIPFKEATLLKLNCDKALAYLNWHSTLSYSDCINFISEWYKKYYFGNPTSNQMFTFSVEQINKYTSEAIKQNLDWSK